MQDKIAEIELFNNLLQLGYAVTLYKNVLGSIVAKAHSVSEIVFTEKEPNEDLYGLRAEQWQPPEQKKAVLLHGEIIVNGVDVAMALNVLYKKVKQGDPQ